MKFRQLLIMFLLFRLFDLAIIFLSRFFIPYLGFFPYKEIALEYNLPRILTALANFDGAHYLLIAEQGYYQYQQAFFPLYPLLIRLLSPVFPNNRLITALVISNLSFLFGLWLFRKYLLDNRDILQDCIKNENNYICENWELEIQHDDNIFYKQKLFLTNFLKWCCVK